MAWTDERIDQLKSMWEKGLTASQIGKAHRLGLKSRPSPVKPGETRPKPAKKEAPKAKPAHSAAAPRSDSVAEAKPVDNTPAESETASTESSGTVEVEAATVAPAKPKVVSVGPGGFLRQGPGDQQPPIPPAPPRRLVPARPSPEIADKTSLLDLNDKICRWPVGHPGEPDFHFCGEAVNPGFPYCVEHCGRAYQAQLPRGTRRPPPPLPFGGPRVR